jgi:heterodisulfide reductase subunit B
MKIGFYPGCSLEGTAREYNESLKEISKVFKIELEEIIDWNCCGATAAHSLNKDLALALPARSLALAEKQGLNEIVVPCAACYSRLFTAYSELNSEPEKLEKIKDIIQIDFKVTSKPINALEFINKYIKPDLKDKIKNKINLNIACYYGCLLVRPPKLLAVERYEDPMIMEEIIKIMGAKPVDWAFKTECCGAGLSVSKTDVVSKLSGKIIDDAISRKADIIMVACQMCQSNLDMRRKSINKYLGKKLDIPVLFITQIIGKALGLDSNKLGLQRHFVPVSSELFMQKEIPSNSVSNKIGVKV